MSNHTNKSIFTKNAVLFKDMSIDMKRPKILIFMLIFNAILFMTAGGFFIYLEAAGMSKIIEENQRQLDEWLAAHAE